MGKFLLLIILVAASPGAGFAQKGSKAVRTKGIAVAFFDEGRLQSSGDQAALKDFEYFLELNRKITKRDFPDVEMRILRRGELLHLPDGTRLNVQTIQPRLGYVLSAPRKKRLMLSGVQSDTDFACAAAAFFRRPTSACPK